MKILVIGASGSGTTTLGSEIEKQTGFKHLDLDNYYWVKTDPPFQKKIPLSKRNNNLKVDFEAFDNVVVSGSIISWGQEWESAFDLVIFIRLENTERFVRLKKREAERYGDKLSTDQKIKKNSKEFLEWAMQYENPNFNGRSLKSHKAWLSLLNCKVLQLNGKTELSNNVEKVLDEIKNYSSG